jgi:hypothetical protein
MLSRSALLALAVVLLSGWSATANAYDSEADAAIDNVLTVMRGKGIHLRPEDVALRRISGPTSGWQHSAPNTMATHRWRVVVSDGAGGTVSFGGTTNVHGSWKHIPLNGVRRVWDRGGTLMDPPSERASQFLQGASAVKRAAEAATNRQGEPDRAKSALDRLQQDAQSGLRTLLTNSGAKHLPRMESTRTATQISVTTTGPYHHPSQGWISTKATYPIHAQGETRWFGAPEMTHTPIEISTLGKIKAWRAGIAASKLRR